MVDVLGSVATIASLFIVIFGLPFQIWENFRRKSCQGLTASLIYSAVLSYTLWAVYGWAKPDVYLQMAQTPGAVFAFILLFQLFYYRDRTARKREKISIPAVRKILKAVYSKESVYLRSVEYTPRQLSMAGEFSVPLSHSYTVRPLSYVSAEQFVRCVSQLSFALVGTLIADGRLGSAAVDFREFVTLLRSERLFFRSFERLRFRRQVSKGEHFRMTLSHIETRARRDFIVCRLKVDGTVEGEIEFVAVLK